ncbi:PA4642 family protein [Mangrovitalea sediminis]|uniref:PA4642 family protein n=1 Tax=Mangrovitalea sediminis TaxID=1982043 RepID=UPI000BE58EF8|nr:PA4642 family protein [Mangrovitalea sediminis]
MSGPDKPKVLDEEWSDERIQGFLFLSPYDKSIDPDYHVLIRAYQAMRADDFRRFLVFFAEAGRNINAVDGFGQTLLDRVSQHRKGTEYAQALRDFGAQDAA